MKYVLLPVGILTVLAFFVITSSVSTIFALENQNETSILANTFFNVNAGDGNASSILTVFLPSTIEIDAGDSVIWNNPTIVSEPHTVTFIKDERFFAPPIAPVKVSNSTEFLIIPDNANVDPVILNNDKMDASNETKTIMIDNARSTYPVVIDLTGKNVTYLDLNSKYDFYGDEKYVNSGWIWPEGMSPPGYPKIDQFSVKFQKPGTYSYLCLIHPWMTGSIIVN